MFISPAMSLRVMAHAEAVTHSCDRTSGRMLPSWRWSHGVRLGLGPIMARLARSVQRVQQAHSAQFLLPAGVRLEAMCAQFAKLEPRLHWRSTSACKGSSADV